ncbi:MAG: glycosyltransferase, partial [Candidatus Wallbacteria bacterium]|nr:glycosyltransferase [Candidatus Wallbacteria bacterium]
QTKDGGCGLQSLLRKRSRDITGIMNGIDESLWNPQDDPLIFGGFNSCNQRGKKKNRQELLAMLGIEETGQIVASIISRMTEQKGLELVREVLDDLLGLHLSLIVLGVGNPEEESLMLQAMEQRRGRLCVKIEFNEQLAHRIVAGSDITLIPSKYEPSSLNQLYSLHYGTIPVVRNTGGLIDAIMDFNPSDGSGNGFIFDEYNSSSLLRAVKRACEVHSSPKMWKKLVNNAMEADFSWKKSASLYKNLYSECRNIYQDQQEG